MIIGNRNFRWIAIGTSLLMRGVTASDEVPVRSEIHTLANAVLQIVEAAEIPATVTGVLIELGVQHGDLVRQGDPLAQVDDTLAKGRLKEAKIELEIITSQVESQLDIEYARKSQQVAATDFRRAQDSNRAYPGVVSDREMDRLHLLVEQGMAELAKLQFEKGLLRMQIQKQQTLIEQHQLEVQRHRIRAAIDGQVVEIKKRRGEWVNMADTVVRIVRLDRVRVEDHLPIDIATQSLVGARAIFQSMNVQQSDPFQGKVVYVSPEINPINSTAMVWIEFENPELTLRPGMKGGVEIRLPMMQKPERSETTERDGSSSG